MFDKNQRKSQDGDRLESGYAEHAWDEHDAMFEAIVSGDEERAVELAQHHAWGAAEHVCAQLAAEQEATG